MTRILITGINYAPEETGIAPYTTRIAEHLASRGYRVTTLAGMPHYPAWRVDDAYARARPLREVRRGVAIERRWHYVPASQSVWRRALYEASFFASGLTALRMPEPDVVLGIVPSLSGGMLARTLATRFRVPYGIVFQDLMGAAAEQSGIAGGALAATPVRAAEAWAARAASAVGVIAEGFRPHVESMGVPANRIRRVRNWTHTGEATVGREAMRAWLGLRQDACICLHAGNMGHKQELENVVATAALAALQAPELTFVLMGEGHQRARLQAMVTERGLTNVRFLPLQSAEIFPSVLAAADVLLINQSPRVVEMSLPSKLTSYFAAGRPVVAAVAAGSETAREITWSSGGVIARPGDPADLLDAIRRVHSDPALAAHLAACGMRWAADVLSEDAALLGYEQLVAAVLAGAPRGRIHTLARQKPRLLTGVASDAPPAEERKAA